jgi:hypothetical protein
MWCLELAKLHVALAQVAVTALNSDGREWVEVAGREFSSTLHMQDSDSTESGGSVVTSSV